MSDNKTAKRGLGRGLSALMADLDLDGGAETRSTKDRMVVPIEQIIPNPDQPRRSFDQAALQELADSLRQRGVLQPLIVRKHPKDDGIYQIVAGERRWRAAQIAQLHELPVVVKELSDTEVLEIAIVENIQRADLNAIEEAFSFRQLMDRFGHTQEKLAEALNKSRSHIANSLRLLTLPDQIQDYLREGKLTPGHARALITADNSAALARRVMDHGLSVRETEALVKKQASTASKPKTPKAQQTAKDADTRALEADLSAQLKLDVAISHHASGAGTVTLSYDTLEQLERICQILGTRQKSDL